MQVAIYGSGYVGLVTGVCLASLGHEVFCVDIDNSKIARLQQGEVPIYEPGLADLLQQQITLGRIHFTTDPAMVVAQAPIQMIAVGTPPQADGAADLSYVQQVAKTIAQHMTDYRLIVNKSTVPVGTAEMVVDIVHKELQQREINVDFAVASNPEFLREGQAMHDFLQPDRIIIGVSDSKAETLLQSLYEPLTHQGYPLLSMQPRAAELAKYAANAFLATKISFINEISQVAERMQADVQDIQRALASDPRIGGQFLNPGCGFGGSCFPKDVAALQHMAKKLDFQPHVLDAVLHRNQQQQRLLFDKMLQYFTGDLESKTIALWGLAFKPDTDDIRCASARVIMEYLWQAGATVQAYDPLASQNILAQYPNQPRLKIATDLYAALVNADVLVIATEWAEFQNPDWDKVRTHLRYPVIFDGRNLFDPAEMAREGIAYYAVGRGAPLLAEQAELV